MPVYKVSTPTYITRLNNRSRIPIRVVGAGTLLIAKSQTDCNNSVGLKVIQGDGVVNIDWDGDIWITSDDGTTENEIMLPSIDNYVTPSNITNSKPSFLDKVRYWLGSNRYNPTDNEITDWINNK